MIKNKLSVRYCFLIHLIDMRSLIVFFVKKISSINMYYRDNNDKSKTKMIAEMEKSKMEM